MKRIIACLLILLLISPLYVLAESNESNTEMLHVGDIVMLGRYEQDGIVGNGPERIEWIVLDVDEQEEKALVISKYNLDRLLYHSRYEPVTWETCDLRNDLNIDFLNDVFTVDEIARIQYTTLHTPDNKEKGTKGGNDTVDRIFLLSAEEAEKYFSSELERNGKTTEYLTQLCSFSNGLENTSTVWWLRTPGENQAHAAFVYGGRVNLGGWAGNVHKLPIRPAMWISIES